MKVLLVNKFLYPKGGAETYTFKLGEALTAHGHSVQYFGLDNPKNIVGNNVDAYVSDMDFGQGVRKNLAAPFRIIYSSEAKRKITKVLYDFEPDVVHMNNIQFHLTPSIILEAEKYRKETGRSLKIIYTAHDYQLVCPNHMLINGKTGKACELCLSGQFYHCAKDKCIHGSTVKSILGMVESRLYRSLHAYRMIDVILCPSFLFVIIII